MFHEGEEAFESYVKAISNNESFVGIKIAEILETN